MKKIVLDTSAIMALLNEEEGYKIVQKHLNNAVVSSVNFSESIAVSCRKVFKDTNEQQQLIELLRNIFPHIIDFDSEQAQIAGLLDNVTKGYGLSLGDRACLALGKYKNFPVLTADKQWKKLKIAIDVQLIR